METKQILLHVHIDPNEAPLVIIAPPYMIHAHVPIMLFVGTFVPAWKMIIVCYPCGDTLFISERREKPRV
jgi:hypothetical protein